MAKVLFKLGRWSYLHKWTVIVAWVLILAGIGGSAAAFQKGFMDQFSIPGMPSAIASKMIEAKFPDVPNPIREQRVYVVFKAPDGQHLDEPGNKAAIDKTIDGIRENVGQIADDLQLVNPVDLNPKMQEMVKEKGMASGLPKDVAEADARALRTLSDDGQYGISTFTFDVKVPKEIKPENSRALLDAMQAGRDAGLTVEAMGPGMQAAIEVKPTSEIVGITVAFIVLVVTFGSLVAAFFPIVTAIVGIIIGVLGVVLMTAWTDVNSITPVLAVMFGLAVGIDYALFIMSRYRSELGKGLDKPDAMGMATGTAGSSVVFAGLTVIVALVALVIAKVPFLSLMGLSAAATVAFSVLVSLSLLPAVLSLFGNKVFAGRVPGIAGNKFKSGRRNLFARGQKAYTPGRTMGRRWVTMIHRAPGIVLVVTVLALLGLSAPAMDLKLALPSDSTAEYTSTNRKAIKITEEGFGAGRNSQLIIVADSDDVKPDSPALKPLVDTLLAANPEMSREEAARKASYSYAADQFKSNVGVEHIQMIGINKDGTAVKMIMTPTSGPLDPATKQLMNALRGQQKQIEESTGLVTGVTGLVPIEIDITDRLEGAMPLYLSVVIGLAIILLLMVFRSIMVPITAGLGFLLSVGAAFGVTVLFFQKGALGLVPTPGPLVSFVPIFLIGVTFGLAMDYQVFLVSRMREHYTHMKGKSRPGSPYTGVEESIVDGFSLGARVVTAAAIIMISVFVAFIGQPLAFVKVFGFALGAAVLFDAFFVRMTLIPAAMFLLGRATWWIPKWLDKVIPTVDVEGAALDDLSDKLAAHGGEHGDEHDAVHGDERGIGHGGEDAQSADHNGDSDSERNGAIGAAVSAGAVSGAGTAVGAGTRASADADRGTGAGAAVGAGSDAVVDDGTGFGFAAVENADAEDMTDESESEPWFGAGENDRTRDLTHQLAALRSNNPPQSVQPARNEALTSTGAEAREVAEEPAQTSEPSEVPEPAEWREPAEAPEGAEAPGASEAPGSADSQKAKRKKLTVQDLAKKSGRELRPPRRHRGLWDPNDAD